MRDLRSTGILPDRGDGRVVGYGMPVDLIRIAVDGNVYEND